MSREARSLGTSGQYVLWAVCIPWHPASCEVCQAGVVLGCVRLRARLRAAAGSRARVAQSGTTLGLRPVEGRRCWPTSRTYCSNLCAPPCAGINGSSARRAPKKDPPIEQTLACTLEELSKGSVRRMKIRCALVCARHGMRQSVCVEHRRGVLGGWAGCAWRRLAVQEGA